MRQIGIGLTRASTDSRPISVPHRIHGGTSLDLGRTCADRDVELRDERYGHPDDQRRFPGRRGLAR